MQLVRLNNKMSGEQRKRKCPSKRGQKDLENPGSSRPQAESSATADLSTDSDGNSNPSYNTIHSRNIAALYNRLNANRQRVVENRLQNLADRQQMAAAAIPIAEYRRRQAEQALLRNNAAEQPRRLNAAEQVRLAAGVQYRRPPAEQLQHAVAEQPQHAAAEQPRHAAAEQPRQAAAEQPRHAAAEQPRQVAAEQPRPMAAEQPRRAAAEQPRRQAAEQPRRPANEQPQHAAPEQPRRAAAEQPRRQAAEQPRRQAAEQPRRQAAEQPRRVSAEIRRPSASGNRRPIPVENRRSSASENRPPAASENRPPAASENRPPAASENRRPAQLESRNRQAASNSGLPSSSGHQSGSDNGRSNYPETRRPTRPNLADMQNMAPNIIRQPIAVQAPVPVRVPLQPRGQIPQAPRPPPAAAPISDYQALMNIFQGLSLLDSTVRKVRNNTGDFLNLLSSHVTVDSTGNFRRIEPAAIALYVVGAEETGKCCNCNRDANTVCGKCRAACYCSSFCLQRDWGNHEDECNLETLTMVQTSAQQKLRI
ncbi:hypothetical protein B5X24_HaOG204410 [Helicoverpa armigera]|uniref:MYND-type domain-containing protein n=1 Tax=Helicoverpa armigera TaxID=29058 RepID=A0A2W1BUW4_HELAM|nr:hypothetical protein B5X24_HaOG204410 [Helicoverpa armigera]